MNPINILFFTLASLMEQGDARIVSGNVTVTIDPVAKTIDLLQEDLFSIIISPADSMAVAAELRFIVESERNVEKTYWGGLAVEQLVLTEQGQQLNARLKARYADPKILEEAGIHLDAETGFSMINIPEWNIQSTTAVLDGNYWVWPSDEPVTFVMEAFLNIPTEYLNNKQSVLTYWQSMEDKK